MACVFCEFSNIKDRTIATIDDFHIVASRGQITDGGYLLLIPTTHTTCLGAATRSQAKKLNNLLSAIVETLEEEYQRPVTFFEHGIVGQSVFHAHLHIFPANVDLKPQIEIDFPKSIITSITDFEDLRLKYRANRQPYLLWSTPRNEILVCWHPPATPEYLRMLTANTLKVPERGKWKEMDPILDQELTIKTMEKLLPILNK